MIAIGLFVHVDVVTALCQARRSNRASEILAVAARVACMRMSEIERENERRALSS